MALKGIKQKQDCITWRTSTHPASYKVVIPYLQFHCLRRICSQDEAFHPGTSEMFSFFMKDDLPTSPIIADGVLTFFSSVSCISALTPAHICWQNRNIVLLVLTFNPTSLRIQNIILWYLFPPLSMWSTTSHIFPSSSLTCFPQRPLSLWFVDSLIPSHPNLPLPRYFLYNPMKCNTCPPIFSPIFIQGSK